MKSYTSTSMPCCVPSTRRKDGKNLVYSLWSQWRYKHHLAKPNIAECSLRLFQQRKKYSLCSKSESRLPTVVRDGVVSLKGFHRTGDGRIFLKTSAPLSLIKTFRINTISAGSISLDCTFKIFAPGVLHGPVPAGRAENHLPENHHSGHEKAACRLQVHLLFVHCTAFALP